MKKNKIFASLWLLMLMIFSICMTGCGQEENTDISVASTEKEVSTTESVTPEITDMTEEIETVIPEGNYIELALNVYYNDADHGYYANENGKSIYADKEGQYTVSFDCAKDLSDDAKNAGVSELKNLTAIYILDMGVSKGNQSSLTSCDIIYNQVQINDTNLTVTQTEPKSAFKSNGVFDTNDPVNAWDGSQVEEVEETAEHVANFSNVSNPATVTVTFTLSNLVWGEKEVEEEQVADKAPAVDIQNGATFSQIDLTDTNAIELTKLLGNGINLGNTMEAYGHATLGTNASVNTYETYWGQPKTTAEMFVGMKNCGFDSVRIPVAWTNMMDYESGDYTINKAYLDRVEEIVNYAIDAEMFVIINDHWDGGWWAMFGSANPETVKKAWAIYESIWTQVADRFKNYSDMLIFESANEELGDSLNDNSDWVDSGTMTQDECYQMTNEINQRFVDLVRSTGGNNDDRFLLIAGYNTDFDKTVDSRFKMPSDTAQNKLLLSVHYYTPWNYCGAEKQAKWGLKSEYEAMNKQFDKLTKFTDAGYGVIIGEYAALPIYNSDGTHELKENTVAFTRNLLNNCDLYNYCPMLWSCNDFYNKKSGNMISKEIGDLFLERCYENEVNEPKTDAEIKAEMEEDSESAPAMWEGVKVVPSGAPVAWIMWNGGAGTYSVGDTYNPADNTKGIVAHDVIVNGAGEYTVSLDFEDGNDGLTFAALAIANGESLFSKPIINIKEITLDGEPIDLIAEPYTTSDDGICTRVNLYNGWVGSIPSEARNSSGDLTNASAVIVDKTQMVGIKNITIVFELVINR